MRDLPKIIDYDKDKLAYALANTLKERDEARNKMADALQEIDLRTLDFERMKQERDEAREAMREAWLACMRVDVRLALVEWQNKHANILEEAK